MQISLFTYPTTLSHRDLRPPLFYSSYALTSSVFMCSFIMDAHLYFGYFSSTAFPLIEKLFISSPANIFVLPLIYLVSVLTCPPSNYFLSSSSKFKSDGIVASKI